MAGWWKQYPWRMIQPNFREIDTKDFDEDRFIEELKSFSATAVMLNAAGLLASYRTELADHTVSPYLDGFDLKHLVDRCHDNGIRVIARTDFSKIPEAVFERHPDWAYRHPDGSPLIYNGYVQTCLMGGYQGGYMDQILREMFEKIPFDGIYCNMGSATGYIVDYSMKRHGPCQCENCRRAFLDKYHMDIPTELRPGDMKSMVYFRFQMEAAGAQKRRITSLLREINPELAYCQVDYARQEAHTDFGETLPAWQYSASSSARAMRGMGVEATVADVDFMGFALRHPSCSAPLQELRLWQTLSNFGGLDYYVIGRLYDKADKSTFACVKRVFHYAAAHENEMYNVTPAGDVLLVRESYIVPNKEERGWVRLLTELHILFDETLSGGLEKKDLSAYKAVILPEKNRLMPGAAEKLNAYVRSGGVVIASGNGSALPCCGHRAAEVSPEAAANAAGKAAANASAGVAAAPGAAGKAAASAQSGKDDMAGRPGMPKAAGFVEGDMLGAMFCIRAEETDRFPDFADRPYLIVGNSYVKTDFADGAETFGVLCPPERFGPPELCYATEAPTAYPAAVRFSYGEGCGITLPWYVGTNYYEDGHEAFRYFVGNVLDNLAGIHPVGENLSPMVEVTRGVKDDFTVVHFVNGSGHFGNSFFEPPVLADQSVTIPFDGEAALCENIDDPGNVSWTLADGNLTITVPRLAFHAAILIRRA